MPLASSLRRSFRPAKRPNRGGPGARPRGWRGRGRCTSHSHHHHSNCFSVSRNPHVALSATVLSPRHCVRLLRSPIHRRLSVMLTPLDHPQQRHEHLSPPQPHLSPASPSSMTSSYNYSTPALSTGTMSSSSSQDAFPAPPTHYPSPPAQQYYHPAGKQPTHAGKVFINPPGRAHPYAGRGTSEEPKGKGRERDWDSMGSPPAPTPVPTMSVPEESTRRGEDLGIGLGDFDMLDTLGGSSFLTLVLHQGREAELWMQARAPSARCSSLACGPAHHGLHRRSRTTLR